MTREESSLKAAARGMEAWERMGRGEIVIGRTKEEDDGSSSSNGSGEEWGDDGDDEDAIRRRKAGVRREVLESTESCSIEICSCHACSSGHRSAVTVLDTSTVR